MDRPVGIQLFDADQAVYESYIDEHIPKFVVIDKQGNVVNFMAPKPSNGDELENLIKQEIEKQLALQKEIQDIPLILGDRIEIEPIPKFTTFRLALRDTDMMDLYYTKMNYSAESFDLPIDSERHATQFQR